MSYAKNTILGLLSLVNNVLLIDPNNKVRVWESARMAQGMPESKNLHKGSQAVPKTLHHHPSLTLGK